MRNSLAMSKDKMQLSARSQRKEIPAEINMISGCHDGQEAVGLPGKVITRTFSFPRANGEKDAPASAFTSSFLEVAWGYAQYNAIDDTSWADFLTDIRETFKDKTSEIKGLRTQVPQLSSSRRHDSSNKIKLTRKKGEKYAVLIGINYKASKDLNTKALTVAHNDVHNIKKYLMEILNFKEKNITVLMDDDDENHASPTKENIIGALEELRETCTSGDTAFFHFSGHGSQIKDENGDEADGLDEILIPVDYKTAGCILDDYLYENFVQKLQRGVLATCIIDSCHSGTALDLPYELAAIDEIPIKEADTPMEQNRNVEQKDCKIDLSVPQTREINTQKKKPKSVLNTLFCKSKKQ
jgi:hypothetical protein